jgi:hypothetical protein
MGKVLSLLVACVLVASALPELAPGRAAAQTFTLPCSVTALTPMQGQYSGPWHSDGDYHFSVFNTDLDLQIIIDGTLSLTVTADGHVSGTASGTVDAPIYDYGRKDVSSGYGTISGVINGTMTGAGSSLVLSAPVIFMHWGTFVGGGYTVDQNITMPDYSFSVGSTACVSSSGSIAETDFPPKWIVPDGTGQPPVLAPGMGTATGTWSVSSTDTPLYEGLSQQVDSFIASANSVLAGKPSYAEAETQIVQPLQALVAAISAHPTVARCLLERLGAWAASTSATLYTQTGDLLPVLPGNTGGQTAAFRAVTSSIRLAGTLGASCHVADGGVPSGLTATLTAAIRSAAATGDAETTALLARELLLWKGAPGESAVGTALNGGLHSRLAGASTTALQMDALRQAYAFGDDADATAAYQQVTAASHSGVAHTKKTKGKKKKKKPVTRPTPKPTPKPTAPPKPTATSTPRTLGQVLTSGITAITGTATGGATPTFSWSAVKSASGNPVRYVVTVTGSSGLLWSWSGSGTSATYGDTTLAGVPSSSAGGWPISLPASYHWTVLARDGSTIIGLKLHS